MEPLSDTYLDFVRRQPCAACQREPPSDPHHFFEREGGMGMKCSDWHVVPLCGKCHRYFHDNGVLLGMTRDRTLVVFYREQSRLLGHWLSVF